MVVAVSDTVGTVESPSRDCWCGGLAGPSIGRVVGAFVSPSIGIIKDSSRDRCDDGMMSSSREGSGMAEVPIPPSAKVTGGSCCDEGVASSYPDSPSDSIISGAPSIESRRVWVEPMVLASPRSLYLLVAVAVPLELLLSQFPSSCRWQRALQDQGNGGLQQIEECGQFRGGHWLFGTGRWAFEERRLVGV